MKKINENTKVTLTLKQLKRLVKESNGFYAGQAWKDTWAKMVLRWDKGNECYVPNDDFKDEVGKIMEILLNSPFFKSGSRMINNPFDSGNSKETCSLCLDGASDYENMRPILDEFYGSDFHAAYKKGRPVSNTGYNKPEYELTLWIDVNGEIPVFSINGKSQPKEMVPRLFANGQKDIDEMVLALSKIADKVYEVAKDEDEDEHEKNARAAQSRADYENWLDYGKHYTGAYAKYNRYRESLRVHESRLNWKGPKVLKRKWDGYTGMVTFRLGKISDEEYYRNLARRCPVDITIETSMGHFSATAMIGNANGTSFNRAGQIIEDIVDHNGYIYKQLPGPSQELVDKIAGWWKQYHLVDLDDIPEEDYDAISEMIEYAKDYEVTEGVLKESDEVKLQMIALKKAYDQIKQGKREGNAGNWKIEALGRWNDDLGLLEHGAYWVYFKDAAILEINYETREYAYLMETAVLSKEMVDAMLDVLECKDFHLDGDDFPDFPANDEA